MNARPLSDAAGAHASEQSYISAVTSGAPRPRRRRDPEASRAAILAAAREAFTELGYDRASVREIARRADAATGLVLRHFASKEQLFLAAFSPAVGPAVGPDAAPAGGAPPDVDALVALVLGGSEGDPSATPFLALIRSADSRPEAAAALRLEMQRRARALLGVDAHLAGAEADLRADVFGALMIGLTFVRHVLGTGALADAPPDQLARVIGPVTRAVLGTSSGGPSADL
jgi:AcrR family transcriptional regulator